MSDPSSRMVPLDALPALLPNLSHVTALPPGAAAWVLAERARLALDADELPIVAIAPNPSFNDRTIESKRRDF